MNVILRKSFINFAISTRIYFTAFIVIHNIRKHKAMKERIHFLDLCCYWLIENVLRIYSLVLLKESN